MILLVRHGPGRGRLPRYLQPILDEISATDPDLSHNVTVHETGTGTAPDLAGFVAVVFWLADPLARWYPDCHAEAVTIAKAARERDLALVNPPDQLDNSVKSEMTRRWHEAGIPCAVHRCLESREALTAHLEQCELPVIVRRDEYHGQISMRVCRTRAQARRAARQWRIFPAAVAPFIDSRELWREAGHRDIWAGYYHSARLGRLGPVFFNQWVFFSRQPIIATLRSSFARWQRQPSWLRKIRPLSADIRSAVECDLAFNNAPPHHTELMKKATDLLGFSYASIDFSILPGNKVVLWEANPYPELYFDRRTPLFDDRDMDRRHWSIVSDYARFFRALLDGWRP